MPHFKIKTVKGKTVRRMTGSSRIKKEKKTEQRRLRELPDWHSYIERYEVKEMPQGSVILIHQEAYRESGPLVYKLWQIIGLKKKLKHTSLADMNTKELTTVAKELGIPLRIITRLRKREIEAREKRSKRYLS
jgi:hypothetical protein